jgi:hypothetical protein
MSKRADGVHPALKHGGYSGIALLPGEDPAAFQQLHSDLIAEFAPDGRLEEDIVESIARLYLFGNAPIRRIFAKR